MEDVDLILKILANLPLEIVDKLLVVIGEANIGPK